MAKDHLATIDQTSHTASDGAVEKWLAVLATMVTESFSEGDLRVRKDNLKKLLAYPAYCYTTASMRDFCRVQGFWPNLKELTTFFDSVVLRVDNERDRCKKLLGMLGEVRRQEPEWQGRPLLRKEWTRDDWQDYYSSTLHVLWAKVTNAPCALWTTTQIIASAAEIETHWNAALEYYPDFVHAPALVELKQKCSDGIGVLLEREKTNLGEAEREILSTATEAPPPGAAGNEAPAVAQAPS